jgi:hypothetical protein
MPCPALPRPAKPSQTYFFGFRGRFQYGLLHFGQIVGTTVADRDTHVCEHRSHRQPSNLIFATG